MTSGVDWRHGLAWTLAGAAIVSSAQAADGIDRQLDSIEGERLSDALVRHGALRASLSLGVQWRIPEAMLPQAELKSRLLVALLESPELRAAKAVRKRMAAWIEQMPVTGRVVLQTQDPRHLQGQPAKDPVIRHGQSVVFAPVPLYVTVLDSNGAVCRVAHASGAEAKDYLRACQSEHESQVDVAWVVQPDGVVQRFGIAPWNRTAQDEPAPGAVIWAPADVTAWPEWFNAAMVRFLASQSPNELEHALGKEGGTVRAPVRDRLQFGERSRTFEHTASDWGGIGLLQTPSARMGAPGETRVAFSSVYPYNRINVMFQPVDWLEAGFRYTSVLNRFYGPATFSGTQNYLDKSLDFKLRLAKETRQTPEVSLGMIDIGGTGLFSSEYLVASKRTGNFDWSLGVAWGYLGNRGSFRNPFSLFSKRMDTRPLAAGGAFGGQVGTGAWFRGPVSPFGGVQWQTPVSGLTLKAEYDGNDYRKEPQLNNQRQQSPFNLGATYRYAEYLDLSLGVERGDTLMLGVAIRGGLDKVGMRKFLDPDPVPVRASRSTGDPDWRATARDLERQTGWTVGEIRKTSTSIAVTLDEVSGAYWNDKLERACAVLHRDAPADVSRFEFRFRERDIVITERVVLRDVWTRKYLEFAPFVRDADRIGALPPQDILTGERVWSSADGPFRGGIGPHFQQTVGGPDGYVLFQAGISGEAEWRLSPRTWLSARSTLRLIDNYTSLVYNGSPSSLPPVRTLLRSYLTASRLNLPNLQLTHFDRLSRSEYFSIYGGYLEYGYAGVGAEYLYRPWHAPFALGIDVNQVRQRGFKQDFALRDYSVNTGHLTLYWDTGWRDTRVKLMAGQYLAGDRGVTLDVSRTFPNGVTLGAYATKTNVSAAEFGEGSFDKGLYLSLPFDAFLPYRSGTMANFFWSPLTRDGGARLGRSNPLYKLTAGADRQTTVLAPYAEGDQELDDGYDDVFEWGFVGELWNGAGTVGRRLARPDFPRPVFLGTGIVLAASLFDRAGARWADRHRGAGWDRAGTAASAIPIVAAAGVGLVWSGILGDDAARTARTSARAMALTFAAETGLKYAVGRARPDAGLGSAKFDPLGAGAGSSAFPSRHVGLAFAAVTPFARRYDAPWLYGLAALTGLGRIQSREHFVSDVIAGGLIGYGIASALYDDDQRRRTGPALIIDPAGGIRANWMFD